MTPSDPIDPAIEPDGTPSKPLTPAAERALAEAAARRTARDTNATRQQPTTEYGGQSGPDPVRYGDWEKGGIVSDF